MGEIVFHLVVIVHHDRRAHRERRNRKGRAEHPLGATILGVEAKHLAVLIGDALEGTVDELGLNRHRRGCFFALGGRILTLERCDLSGNLGNLGEGPSQALGACLGTLHVVANVLEPRHTREARVHLVGIHRDANAIVEWNRAVEADHIRKLLDGVEELVEIDGTSQCNVSEVTRAELVRLLAGGADLPILNDTEACIKHAIRNRLVALVGLVGGDFHDGALANILGIRNPKLNSNDSVAHDAYSYALCRFFRFYCVASSIVVFQRSSSSRKRLIASAL